MTIFGILSASTASFLRIVNLSVSLTLCSAFLVKILLNHDGTVTLTYVTVRLIGFFASYTVVERRNSRLNGEKVVIKLRIEWLYRLLEGRLEF